MCVHDAGHERTRRLRKRPRPSASLRNLRERSAPTRPGVVGDSTDREPVPLLGVRHLAGTEREDRHAMAGSRERGGLAVDARVCPHVVRDEHDDVHSVTGEFAVESMYVRNQQFESEQPPYLPVVIGTAALVLVQQRLHERGVRQPPGLRLARQEDLAGDGHETLAQPKCERGRVPHLVPTFEDLLGKDAAIAPASPPSSPTRGSSRDTGLRDRTRPAGSQGTASAPRWRTPCCCGPRSGEGPGSTSAQGYRGASS